MFLGCGLSSVKVQKKSLNEEEKVARLNPIFWADSQSQYVGLHNNSGFRDVNLLQDRSINGFNLVQNSAGIRPTYIPDGFGTKGSFDNGELKINPEPFNLTQDFSVAVWFKQSSLQAFRFPISIWGSNTNFLRSFGIRNGQNGAGMQLAVSPNGQGSQSNTNLSDKPILANEWYMAYGYHRNGVEIGFRMFDVRGREIGVEQVASFTAGVFDTVAPFKLGAHTNIFNGQTSDAYLFDRILDNEEINTLFNYSQSFIIGEGFVSELGAEIAFDELENSKISELGTEIVFQQTENNQISELGTEIVFEEI